MRKCVNRVKILLKRALIALSVFVLVIVALAIAYPEKAKAAATVISSTPAPSATLGVERDPASGSKLLSDFFISYEELHFHMDSATGVFEGIDPTFLGTYPVGDSSFSLIVPESYCPGDSVLTEHTFGGDGTFVGSQVGSEPVVPNSAGKIHISCLSFSGDEVTTIGELNIEMHRN
jgi:hypothetical protein